MDFFKKKIWEVKAVDGVSFDIFKGETLGLVGESCCVKTTIGSTILNLFTATSGDILYQGQKLVNLKRFSSRKKIGKEIILNIPAYGFLFKVEEDK